MTSLYHARTLDLLGSERPRERRPVPELAAWADAQGVVLPAAYLEWAELGGGALLEKYSNCSRFHFDAPRLVDVDGQRALKFEEENQGNFTTVVLLGRGDDPPVLFGWIGDAPWVTFTERFSDAVYAQIFDWQFQVDWDPDDSEDDAGEDDDSDGPVREGRQFSLRTDRYLDALHARCAEVVGSRIVVDGDLYTTRRFLPSSPATNVRIVAQTDPDRATHLTLTSEGPFGQLAPLETELLEAFADDVLPRSFGLVKTALDFISDCLVVEQLVRLRHACIETPAPAALAALVGANRTEPFYRRKVDPHLDHNLSLRRETRFVLEWGGAWIAIVRQGRAWAIECIRA